MKILRAILIILALTLAIAPALAVPQMIHYQGRVSLNGTLVNGPGEFKFALVNGDGSTAFWGNNNNFLPGPNHEPTSGISLTVVNGLYSVLLGDDSLAGMSSIPSSVFSNPDVRLRVWYDAGVANGGWQLLTPDQRIASVGYAMMAGTVPNGSITTAKLAADTVTANQIANGSVTLQKLDFSLGAPGQFLTTNAFGATWQSVGWANLAGIPGGFADGVDNDTLFSAGAGLSLAGTEFSVNFAGNGSAQTAARSDHGHFGHVFSGTQTGAGLTVFNTHDTGGGVLGWAAGDNGLGILGLHSSPAGIAAGVQGETASTEVGGRGVYGKASATTGTAAGVWGEANSVGGLGLRALNATAGSTGAYITGGAFGVRAEGNSEAMRGTSASGLGVGGYTTDGTAVYGSNGNSNTVGHAGYFNGRVRTTGELRTDDIVWATGPGFSNGLITRQDLVDELFAGFFDGNVFVSGILEVGQAVTTPTLTLFNELRVANAGVNTPTVAFIHRATAGSLRTLPGDTAHTATIIDHPLLNFAGTAMVFVTHLEQTPNPTSKSGVSVLYDAGGVQGGISGRWLIRAKQDGAGASISANDTFNVLIIKP